MFILPPIVRCNPLKGRKLYLNRTFNLSLSTLRATVVTTRWWENIHFFKTWWLGKVFFQIHTADKNNKNPHLSAHIIRKAAISSSHAGRDTCHTWMEVFDQKEQYLVHWKIKRKPCQNVVCYNHRAYEKIKS